MVSPHVLRTVMTVAAAVLALVALPAEAQWKWRDKGGRVQYSDLPPPLDTPDQDILSRPNAQRRSAAAAAILPASAASAPLVASVASNPLTPRVIDPELEARRKKAEVEQAAKVKIEEDKIALAKADNCSRARAQLRTLDSGIRISRTNDKGEREFLDDKQRADETKHAKDAIAADCK
ncbi:MAG: DUF4124 domain-containing protein [Caldimonas sp.]